MKTMNGYSFCVQMRLFEHIMILRKQKGGFLMATIQDVIDGKIDIPESERLLGVKVIDGDMATNEVVCEWTIEEQHLNRAGIALGGFTAAVADVAIGYAGALVMEEGYTFTSVNLVTTFHRPIHLGTAIFTARLKRRGRTMLYGEVEITQEGKLVGDVVTSLMTFPVR